jgi:hypothetical protein
MHSSISDRIIVLSSPPPQLESKDHAKILVTNFIRSNDDWPLDSIFSYCLHQYSDFKVTPFLISECIREYIESPTH